MKTRRRKTPRKRFDRILTIRRTAISKRIGIGVAASLELADRIRSYSKTAAKKDEDHEVFAWASKRLEDWEIVELRRPIADRVARDRAVLRREMSWYDHLLDRLAPKVEILPGPFRLFKLSRSYTYATQTDRIGYARRAAHMTASELETHGVIARVEPAPKGEYPSFRDFRVEVAVESDLDVEVLRRLPGPSPREWLKACWRNGINPRVINPYLPHGLEAKLGIDHQGRDIPRAKTPS